jgi:hypothetical protein
MTTGDPQQPSQPFGGTEYPSLEDSAPQPDPNPPVDYPTDAGLPPPVYPPPHPGAAGYPGYPGYYQDGYAIALIGAIIGGLAFAGWVIYLLLSIGIYASGWQWAP